LSVSAKKRWRALIVVDEELARHIIRELLQPHSEIEIAAECANGFEAVKTIGELQPDLVFLDVQMPKLTGFEVLELLDPGPAVVFCTAYDEYALKAFEVHAVDYLLKPFGRERLAEAMTRVRARRREDAAAAPPAPGMSPAALASAARPAGRWLERVLVREGPQVHVIPVERLDYLEAQDDYIAIHSDGRTWLKTQPLAELAEGLDPDRFVRIHRSYVLNVDRLSKLELFSKDNRIAILKTGQQLPVSRAGYARLRELM